MQVVDWPLARLVTVTLDPNGSQGLAAVMAWLGAWYQVAWPVMPWVP